MEVSVLAPHANHSKCSNTWCGKWVCVMSKHPQDEWWMVAGVVTGWLHCRRVVKVSLSKWLMFQQLSKWFVRLWHFFVTLTEIKYNPVSKWTKFDLLSKGAQGALVLALQINWGTLNNLVINSPLAALVIFSDMTNWQIGPLLPWLLPSLSRRFAASHHFFYFTAAAIHPHPPNHLLFLVPHLNGGMTAAYQSRS